MNDSMMVTDLRNLIIELAKLLKEHAHTDGPDVNWTRPAAWRESKVEDKFRDYNPPGVYCHGAGIDNPDANFNQDYR